MVSIKSKIQKGRLSPRKKSILYAFFSIIFIIVFFISIYYWIKEINKEDSDMDMVMGLIAVWIISLVAFIVFLGMAINIAQ